MDEIFNNRDFKALVDEVNLGIQGIEDIYNGEQLADSEATFLIERAYVNLKAVKNLSEGDSPVEDKFSLLRRTYNSVIKLSGSRPNISSAKFREQLISIAKHINSFILKYQIALDNSDDLAYLKRSVADLTEKTRFITAEDIQRLDSLIELAQLKYNQLSELEENANKKFTDISANLDLNANKIAETVGRLSTDAVSGRFNSRAKEEQRSAEAMKWFAITLMVMAVVLVMLTALNALQYVDWMGIAVKFLATTTLFITAGYFANESNKHRKLQHKYERIHLDLSAIDPFIATFDEETQKVLKSEVARRVFVTSHAESVNGNSPDDTDIPNNLTDVMQELLKVLKAYNKKEG